MIDNYKPIVIAVEETFYGGDFVVWIAGYNGIRKQGHFNERFHGGVAMYIHNSMPYWEIHIKTNHQIIAAQVNVSQYEIITCVSAYIPGSTNFNDELGRILHELPQLIIIICDLNAHHTNWGNRLTDRRGRQLQELSTSHQLNIVNENIPTHVSGTSIDMTIVSPDLSPDITWTVAPSVLSSDHFSIIILFNIVHPAVKLSEEGWNYRNGKWEEYGRDKVWSHLNDELPDDSHSIL